MAEDRNPFGLHTVTPFLVVEDVATLIDFVERVFDAKPRGAPRHRQDGSVQHAEVRIGDSVVMMAEPTDDDRPMPGMLYLYVDDCDATHEKALAAGATELAEPADHPHGDRYGGIEDPCGNVWWIVTHVGKPT